MRNVVTLLVEDKWIAVDGEIVEFPNGFVVIPEHTGLWALHWNNGVGEYQFDNPPANYFFDESKYEIFVEPYVIQWETEKARQEAEEKRRQAEFEAEWNKLENVEARARETRNGLLAETDYMLMPDYPLTDAQRSAWAAYRQALRDLPEQEGWPESIVWPEKPDAVA